MLLLGCVVVYCCVVFLVCCVVFCVFVLCLFGVCGCVMLFVKAVLGGMLGNVHVCVCVLCVLLCVGEYSRICV